ncbi:MAG: DUF4390 domain-containing protein [Acidobacteria bacterium]|nr:DUF4390 domain-containing protein [Acidobacteriota bacterium]
MLRRASLLLLASLVVAASAAPPRETIEVVPLIRDGEVLVSFKLDEAMTDDIRAAIHSGLTIKLVYTVDLRRTAAVWFDRTIATAVVAATVRYDTLTRRYHVSRTVDGRIDWAETMASEETTWNALTRDFARLSLFRGLPLEPNAEYYVRVRAHSTPRNTTFAWPWQGDDAVGLAKFTFLR